MDNLANLKPEQIQQLIGLLQQMLPQQETEAPKTKRKTTKKKQSSVLKTKNLDVEHERENKFLDMPENKMHKSDSLIDKQLNRYPPTPRSRDFSYVDVVCRLCGKKEKVSPKLVPESIDRYKCNRCSSSEG